MSDQTVPGRIEISPTAIASIASHAVLESYGVVGMASPRSIDGIAQLLHREQRNRGVRVAFSNDSVTISLYVIFQFGTRIATVAENVRRSVKYGVERAIGRQVTAVNVYVQGLRMPKDVR